MKTTMDPPVTLELPLDEPEPAPGCGVCGALARQRAQAVKDGDPSRATDCSVEIRNHPHPKHAGGTS
ncbi:hypothetical protein ACFWOX_04730 [Streptomyces sp. NPDC058467]|uniref:hypothetical protein n=1 Tax=unclassified Streptomyces TaxID=2593676 RepID=UPI00364ADD2B